MNIIEALVPALVWHSVPVVRRVADELTVVEEFVLHSALSMGATGPAEVREVTGISEPAVARVAGRLVDLGLLVRDGEGFQPVGSEVRPALDERVVRQVRTERWSFLYLPYADDVIAFDPGGEGGTVVRLHDVSPAAVAPVPEGLAGVPVTDFLGRRAGAGRVAGLPVGLIDVGDIEGTVPDECPAYRCRGTVEQNGGNGPLARLDVLDPDDPEDRRGALVVGATRLVERWRSLSGDLEPTLSRWRAEGGQATVQTGEDGDPEIRLDAAATDLVIGEGVAVSRPTAVTVRTPDSVIETAVSLRPADPQAAERFAVDDAVQTVVETPPEDVDGGTLSGVLDTIAADYEVPRDDLTATRVERELWSGGHYRHLYAARAARDFGDG